MTKVGNFSPRNRAPSAMPSPTDNPWPREPVEVSRPGSLVTSGWPCSRELPLSNVLSSSIGRKPRRAITVYSPMDEWPFERMNRSLCGQGGICGSTFIDEKKSAINRAMAENGPPTWPAPLLATVLIANQRPRLANASSSSWSSFLLMNSCLPVCSALFQIVSDIRAVPSDLLLNYRNLALEQIGQSAPGVILVMLRTNACLTQS